MRIGIGIVSNSLDEVVEGARRARDEGYATAWLSQTFSLDAMTALAVVGREVDTIELGTFVVPTFPRHPTVMAQQALTVQAASGGRFVLGVGLSHQIVIETMFGLSFQHPARHMREYLSALVPLIREGKVRYQGEEFRINSTVEVAGATPCPVVVAALGPRMLEIAGTLADGTATWMTGPATLAEHIVPTIATAAQKAGRPAPRIIAGLPVCVTDDVDAARERASRDFAIYGGLPSYRAMLDREGAGGPADVAVVGDEKVVESTVARLEEAGVTDFHAAPFGSREEQGRTRALLRSLA